MRPVAAVVLAAAIVVDALVGTLRTGAPGVPLMTLSVVVVIALRTTGSTGAVAGFGAGVVVDLLAGPASPGGVHALVGLAVGACVGALRPRALGPFGVGAAVGAPAVAAASAATLTLQGLATSASSLPIGTITISALAGAVACPMVLRFLSSALPERRCAA